MNLSEYSNFDLDIIKVENIETLSTGMIRTRYTIKISLNNSNDTKIVEVFPSGQLDGMVSGIDVLIQS